ncbi:sterol desaturase family protein [Henriciella aquimarina]|uniref:sterol desaturase family protein n=1 Tax=Henriciella aquimarina TaxID=545261 RepID=UPI000A001CBA|nr:sterol desaturase family protein [Henriciella aquimarina]
MADLPVLGMIATPIVLAAIATEWWAVRQGRIHGRYNTKDALTSLTMGAGNIAINSALAFLSFWVLSAAASLRAFDFGYSVASILGAVVVHDFLYYWKHRIGHRARWFWAEHVTHHSSEHYNLTTALRQPWTGPITGLILTGGPMVLLGFPIPLVLGASSFHLIYQLWIHTEAIGKLPAPFEAVLVTPSHHRVHHATNPQYLDANFGGTLIVWDRLFGTFVPEASGERTRFGIVKPLHSYNPLIVAYHGFAGLFADFWRDGLRPHRWAMRAFNPPGWSPDGDHYRSDEIKAEWRARQGVLQGGTVLREDSEADAFRVAAE